MKGLNIKTLLAISAVLLLVNIIVSASLALFLDPAKSIADILSRIFTTHVLSIPLVCAVLAFIPTHFSSQPKLYGANYVRGFLVFLTMTYALFFCLMLVRAIVEFSR